MDVSTHHDCRRQQQSGDGNDDVDSSSSDGISPAGVCSSPMSTSLLKRKHLMSRAGASLDADVSALFLYLRKLPCIPNVTFHLITMPMQDTDSAASTDSDKVEYFPKWLFALDLWKLSLRTHPTLCPLSGPGVKYTNSIHSIQLRSRNTWSIYYLNLLSPFITKWTSKLKILTIHNMFLWLVENERWLGIIWRRQLKSVDKTRAVWLKMWNRENVSWSS